MPRNHRRRRNPGDRLASRPRYGRSGSKSDSSSDEFSPPHRIATPRHAVSSQEFSEEEESSGGWSSNADFSGHCDEELMVQEVAQPIATILEQTETVEDGLLLVSDDENDMEDDEDYLSADSALRVHRSFVAEPPRNSYELFDGTHLETTPDAASLHRPDFPAIPSSVAILEQRLMDQLDTSEPSMDDSSGKCYDARYDGSLKDLTHGLQLSYSSHDHPNDNDSSSSSMDEMKGYLSTGDLRCPNIFLKPNVGERPPTPPSPSRKSARAKSSANTAPSSALLELQEESSEIVWTPPSHNRMEPLHTRAAPEEDTSLDMELYSYSDASGTSGERPEPALSPNNPRLAHQSLDAAEADGGPDIDPPEDYFAHYDAPPSIYPTHSLPDGSGVMTSSQADELSDAMRLLVEQQSKSRRLVLLLILALLCTLVALAAVAGGVVALLLTRGDASPPPLVPASENATVPVPSPMVTLRAPSSAPKAAASGAPIVPPVPAPVVPPSWSFQGTPTQAPTPKPSLRPLSAAPITPAPVAVATTPAPVTVATTPAPVSFGSLPASNPTAALSTAIPTAASIKIP